MPDSLAKEKGFLIASPMVVSGYKQEHLIPAHPMKDSSSLWRMVHEALVAAGHNVGLLYAQLGYPPDKLPSKDLRTPHALQIRFWDAVESMTGDPDIGLRLCPYLPPFRGEVLEYLMFSSPTFADGIERTLKYLRLLSDAMEISLVRDAQGVRTVIRSSTLDAAALRHTEICVAYGVMQFARSVTDQHFQVQKIRLRYPSSASSNAYREVFGCPVELGADATEIWFDPKVLTYRSPRWDPDLLRLHEGLAEKKLSSLEREDLIENIRTLFSQRLELENCTLEDVARELNIPTRRLRFELSRTGKSFSRLLADFRYALARKLLRNTDESIDNIVYLTGFSEPSTFYRAFKRWSGLTPVQYREQHKAGKRRD